MADEKIAVKVTGTEPEVNGIAPPPAPTPSSEPNTEPSVLKEAPAINEAKNETLPAVKQAPVNNPDPVTKKMPEVDTPKPAVENTDHNPDMGSNHPGHEHRNNKRFASILVVLLAALLAGAAVFVYSSTQDNAQESTTDSTEMPSQNEQQPAATQPAQPATTQSVDQTIEDIDQTLESLDDDLDFGEDQLSDDTLGL